MAGSLLRGGVIGGTERFDGVTEFTLDEMLESNLILSPGAVCTREAYRRADGVRRPESSDLRCAEDYDLWLRAMAAGARHVYVPRVLVRYRRRPGQLTASLDEMLSGTAESLARLAASGVLNSRRSELARASARRYAEAARRRRVEQARSAFEARLLEGEVHAARREFLRVRDAYTSTAKFALATPAVMLSPRLYASFLRRRTAEEPVDALRPPGNAAMGAPVMSVILHCDAEETATLATLTALGGQTLRDIEVILAGEAPDTVALRDAAVGLGAAGFRRLDVAPLRGVASVEARNEAVIAAGGQYVQELRSGDIPAPTMLEKSVWALATRPRTALAYCTAGLDPVAGEPTGGSLVLNQKCSTFDDVVAGGYVFRKVAWEQAQGFASDAPNGCVDGDLCMKMLARGWGVTRVTEDLLRQSADDRAVMDTHEAWLRARHPGVYHRAESQRRWAGRWARVRATVPLAGRVADRVMAKLEAENLANTAVAVRHPAESVLKLLPGRLKGEWWDSIGLPRTASLWHETPAMTDLPVSAGLESAVAQPTETGVSGNVLVLHPYLIAGGAETVLLNLFTHINRKRFAMHLITTEAGPLEWRWMNNPLLPEFAAQVDSIFHLPAFLDEEYRLRFVVDFIRSRKIDVVLISLSIFGYNALAQLRRSCPDVAVIDLLHAEAPYAPMDHMRLASLHRQLLDRRVVVTETVRAVQIAKYGETRERVVVIPNGVDTADTFDAERQVTGIFRRQIAVRDDVAIVLFFGRIAAEKQPMHVLEVAERLRDRQDIVFAVVGDGAEKPALEAAVAARGLTSVILRPQSSDIAPILRDADMVFFPSMREGLPMSGLEAMAMGRPVVASRVEGWVDLVEDGVDGLLVTDGDFDGYAEAIARLVDDPALAARMSAAGRLKAVTSYDATRNVRKWEQLLSDPRGAFR